MTQERVKYCPPQPLELEGTNTKMSIPSEVLAPIVASLIVLFVTYKVKQSSKPGQLKYSWVLLALGFCCFLFVLLAIYAFFYDLDAWEKTSEMVAIIGLFIGFGSGTFFSVTEYYKVYGNYDKEKITFYTPWTGLKDEKWDNLESVKYNHSYSWYELRFKNKKVIRLSTWLSGYEDVLMLVEERGFSF